MTPRKQAGQGPELPAPVEGTCLLWNSVCFLFLLLSLCIFRSYYFLHVRAELQATALQASRCFTLYNAADFKSIDLHLQAEKSRVQLKRHMPHRRSTSRAGRAVATSRTPWAPARRQGHAVRGAPPRHRGRGGYPGWTRPHPFRDYFLFESISKEEQETQVPRPWAQSAFQMAYQRESPMQQEQGWQDGLSQEPREDLETEAAWRSPVAQQCRARAVRWAGGSAGGRVGHAPLLPQEPLRVARRQAARAAVQSGAQAPRRPARGRAQPRRTRGRGATEQHDRGARGP